MTKKKFTYEERKKNSSSAYSALLKATESARERLKREGIDYPIYDSSISARENYEAVIAYGELESSYIREFLRMPNGPRPITEFPKREVWNGYID